MTNLRFDQHQLANGLSIIGEYNARAQSVAAGYFVNTGSRDETAELAGVSHFLEHMMFKGTARRTAEDINREFDELGASYNAYTNEERTVYYGAVLPERQAQLLDLLTDMMRPALQPQDFDIEKRVILEEIAMYDDRPNFKVFDFGTQMFFQGHPLGNSVLGSRDSIQALTQVQMQQYFQSRYAPNNMLVSIAGRYDWQAVIQQLEEATSEWLPQETQRRYPDLNTNTGRQLKLDAKLKRAHVAIFTPGVSAQDSLRYAAALIATCLGDTSGSRLYWALVDKGLADAASLSHDTCDKAGMFVGYLSADALQLEAVLEIFLAELHKVEDQGLRVQEWERAQRKLATALTLRAETPFGRLMSLGVDYLYTQGYQTVQDMVDAVLQTSLDDGGRLLEQRPFSRAYAAVLLPEIMPETTPETTAYPSSG